MNTTYEAGMARLQALLDEPVEPRSPVLRELADQRHERPDATVKVKQAAVVAVPDTDTGTGTFTALVSDYQTDRQNERFLPGAWDLAIAKIKAAGKPLPLLFGHSITTSDSVIGLVQPDDIWADEKGLWIKGWIDTADAVGQRLHRMIQKGVLSWSVGFTIGRKQRGKDGVTELAEVSELFEVSATPIPANPRATTTTMKSADDEREPPSLDELRRYEAELGLNDDEKRRQEIADEFRRGIVEAMTHTNGSDGEKTLRERAEKTARECGAIVVASFDC
jgi:HK97 family phage prohead protease